MSAVASAFQALADPTRLRLLELLRGGEHAVNDLAERVPMHQSGVSRHLRILQGAGFVDVRRDAQRRLYALRPDAFAELEGWLASYQRLWEGKLDRLGRALEEKGKGRHARSRS